MPDKKKKPRIRPLAICIIMHEGKTLVSENFDTVKQQQFYRPLGGGIHFGENGRDAILREITEETGQQALDIVYIGVLENIFICEGEPGHEIVLVYRGRIKDERFYNMVGSLPPCVESNGEIISLKWVPLDEFATGRKILYPDGLLQLVLPA